MVCRRLKLGVWRKPIELHYSRARRLCPQRLSQRCVASILWQEVHVSRLESHRAIKSLSCENVITEGEVRETEDRMGVVVRR